MGPRPEESNETGGNPPLDKPPKSCVRYFCSILIHCIMNAILTSRPDIMAVLEDRGYRSTAPRRAIVRLLAQKQEGFTAEEICKELPVVGRATIFRTIKLLLNADVICKLNLLDGAPRYSLSRVEHHHHTVCVRCGNVGEFRAVTVERLMRAVGDDIPGEIVGHRIELYITCVQCMEDVKN